MRLVLLGVAVTAILAFAVVDGVVVVIRKFRARARGGE